MRKKQVTSIIIEGALPYRINHLYQVIIQSLRLQTKRSQIIISVRHVDSDQDGRIFTTLLPLPVRPDNPTFRFLKAGGVENLSPGNEFLLQDLVGHRIGIRFLSMDDSGIPQTILFEKLTSITHKKKKEPAHEVLPSQNTK